MAKFKPSQPQKLGKIIESIKAWQNPYPKDIFKWDNQERMKLRKGRFNQFIFEVVENTREAIVKIIEEEKEAHQ